MPESPQVVQIPADAGLSWQQVYADLKGDIIHRFDRQDDLLDAIHSEFGTIHSELKTMATKEDVRDVREDMSRGFREAHQRIDEMEERTKGLEDERTADAVIATAQSRFRNRAWAVATAVLVPIGVALILVFVH